jgi:tetratricopeptide (TPR) repeat protein
MSSLNIVRPTSDFKVSQYADTVPISESYMDQNNKSSDVATQDDTWPWSTVDIPGSPQLSRLFEVLRLDDVSGIEALSLSDELVDTSPATKKFISGSELHALSKVDSYASDDQLSISRSHQVSIPGSVLGNPQAPELKHYYDDSILLLSGNQLLAPSPFTELYPFPSFTKSKYGNIVSNLNFGSLKARASHLESYLETFGSRFSADNPIILQSMEAYASTLVEIRATSQGAEWWRRVIDLLERSDRPQTFRKISAMNKLLKCLQVMRTQAKAEEIQLLESQTWELLKQNVPLEHDLTLEFMERKGDKLMDQNECTESERIFRNILQIRLTRIGPRHVDTIRCMSALAVLIPRKLFDMSVGKISEEGSNPTMEDLQDGREARSAIRLGRIAMQLLNENGSIMNRDGQKIVTDQMFVLRMLGRIEEACRLAEDAMKRYAVALGESHATTLRCMADLGSNYRQLGRFAESVAIFQKVNELQKKDTNNKSVAWRNEELAKGLEGMERYQEAAVCFEKVFWAYFEYYGVLDEETAVSCQDLGNCYVKMGHWKSAMEFYKQYIEKIRDEGVGDGVLRLITKVQRWIENLAKENSGGGLAVQ